MSLFLPIKAGGWAFGEILTSFQMNQLNTDFPFAINGRDGGTYNPTAAIIIGGAGIQVTGVFQAIGAASFSSPITVGDDSTFNGLATFNAGIDATTGVFAGLVNMTAGGQVEGGFAVSGGATVSGGFTSNNRATFSDRVLANAGTRRRIQNLGTLGASVTRSIDTADVFFIPDSSVSTLDFKILEPTISTVEDGLTVVIVVGTVNNIVVKDPTGVALITITHLHSGSIFAAEVCRISGSWVVIGTAILP